MNSTFSVGDIVLARFPFAEITVVKQRPAIVISLLPHSAYLVAYITSAQFTESTEFDILLQPDEYNNLKVVSRVRINRMTTLGTECITRKLGTLENKDKEKIYSALQELAKQFR